MIMILYIYIDINICLFDECHTLETDLNVTCLTAVANAPTSSANTPVSSPTNSPTDSEDAPPTATTPSVPSVPSGMHALVPGRVIFTQILSLLWK